MDVERVWRPLAPVDGISGEDGHGGDRVAVLLRDEDLAAPDSAGELVARERSRPLLVTEAVHPGGRLVHEAADGLDVPDCRDADVHSTSIASPKE